MVNTSSEPSAADALPLLAGRARADGSVVWVSARWAEYTGRPGPAHMADVAGCVHPADRPRVGRLWERAVEWSRPFRTELRLRSAAGRYRWFVVHAAPAGDEWVGTATDVHRLKRAERRKRSQFRRAADAVAGIVYDFDPRTGRVTRHRGLFEVLGYRPDELAPTGAAWLALIHPDDRPRVTAAGLALAPGTDRIETRYRVRHADGRWRHVHDRALAVWDGDRLARLVGCTVDVTADTEAGDALRAADRRKDDRLAQIAHELRNPLAPIRAAAETLAATPDLPPAVRAAGAVIGRQVRHLSHLVEDLLDVTRIARGQVRLDRRRLDLRAVLADAAEAARPQCDARSHSLAVDLPPAPLAVDADPDRLRQVFANLLTNAAKYTPDGGAVRLCASAAGGVAVVRVSDTGLGLPADQLDRIFEPFAQLDGGQRRSAGGLGIGLALVRSLVELHAGTVTAASDGTGLGSTFTVTLPLAQSAAGRLVVVVDDHPDAADSLAGLLRLMGHTAEVAADGPGGLELVRRLRPDVALVDLNLPGLSGAELAATVRADSALAGVRLVAVSGDGRPPAGVFDAVLAKPLGAAELRDVLGESTAPPGT